MQQMQSVLATQGHKAMKLAGWVEQARAHWREYLPSRYRQLKQAGKLEQALRDAADATERELTSLKDQGFDHEQAWEMARNLYLFPQGEPDPDLKKPTASASLYREKVAINRILKNHYAGEEPVD